MFGFININKPKGITSFDVIYRLRKILKIKKIGHMGTLDPLAEGVLPVAIGDATRLMEYLADDKKYIATIKFGQSSLTYDEEGEKTPFREPSFSEDDFLKALEDFRGEIFQKPPVYSAIKVKGKKLYEMARKGKDIPDIEPRRVTIYDINLLEFTPPFAKLEIHCSKGTYIRSIAHDLGEKLNCGAYLSGLIRSEAGNFKLEDSKELENITAEDITDPLKILDFPQYELSEEEYLKIKNGNNITAGKDYKDDARLLLTYSNKLVSIGKISANITRDTPVVSHSLESKAASRFTFLPHSAIIKCEKVFGAG